MPDLHTHSGGSRWAETPLKTRAESPAAPAVVVGDPDVQFPVEAAESPQGRINGVRPLRLVSAVSGLGIWI